MGAVGHPAAVNAEVPRRKPGREKGRAISNSLVSLAAFSNFSLSKRVRLRIGSTFGRFGFTAHRTKWDTLSPSREEAHVHEPYGVVGEGRRLLLIAQLRQLGDACLIVIDTGGNHVGSTFGT